MAQPSLINLDNIKVFEESLKNRNNLTQNIIESSLLDKKSIEWIEIFKNAVVNSDVEILCLMKKCSSEIIKKFAGYSSANHFISELEGIQDQVNFLLASPLTKLNDSSLECIIAGITWSILTTPLLEIIFNTITDFNDIYLPAEQIIEKYPDLEFIGITLISIFDLY